MEGLSVILRPHILSMALTTRPPACFVYVTSGAAKGTFDVQQSGFPPFEQLTIESLSGVLGLQAPSLSIMSSREEVTLPATRPKSRKSLAHIPSSQEMDQENMTADIGALAGPKKVSKKSRSKSIGPGGLDALKHTTGNRRKVWSRDDRSKNFTDVFAVAGCSASSEIYSETHNATPTRNPGAHINKEDKSEEIDPPNRDRI